MHYSGILCILKNSFKQKQNGEDQFEGLEWHFRIQNPQLYSRITNAFVMILDYKLFYLVLYSLKLTYQVRRKHYIIHIIGLNMQS